MAMREGGGQAPALRSKNGVLALAYETAQPVGSLKERSQIL